MSDKRWNALIIALAMSVLACTLFVVVASFVSGVGAQESPSFTARWQGSTVAVLRWQQPAGVALTCLTRETATGVRWPITCWSNLAAGPTWTTLGDRGPRDATVHPQPGDVYRLAFDDRAITADLLSLVWLPMVRG